MRTGLVLAILTLAFAQTARDPDVSISPSDRLKVFEKAWETVNKKLFDPKFNGVDWAQMKQKYRPLAEAASDKIELQAVLNRMVNELHVSHMSVDSGLWYGIGLSYVRFGQQYIVRRAYPGSPAQIAGIERGWLLKGSSGDCNEFNRKQSNIFLDVQGREHSLELSCGVIPAGAETWQSSARMLDQDQFYLTFQGFSKRSSAWFAEQLAAHRTASIIVIDLRDNSGGQLAAVRDMLNHLFEKKTVVGKKRRRNGSESVVTIAGSGPNAYRGRVFLLTDERSASAAEIFAATIQETRRGTVVGRTTAGQVLPAADYRLPNGFSIGVAVTDYFTAKGTRLEGRGVIPDELVTLTIQDIQENKDPDLDRVRQLLSARRPPL